MPVLISIKPSDRLIPPDAPSPSNIAESEVRRFEGTLQLEFFRQAEVPELVWSSEDWPELNGRTVKTGEPFVKRGEELTSKNGETYVARTDIRHTPLNSKDQSTMAAKRGN